MALAGAARPTRRRRLARRTRLGGRRGCGAAPRARADEADAVTREAFASEDVLPLGRALARLAGTGARQEDAWQELRERVTGEVGKVVVGQEDVVEQLLAALRVGGHVLLEGVPGVAKTLLANATARALGLDVPPPAVHARHAPVGRDRHDDAARRRARVPARPGVHRACCSPTRSTARRRRPRRRCSRRCRSARSRSRASRGRCPTRSSWSRTQNPIEYEGTYPLPEAQLDRFLREARRRLPERGGRAAAMLGCRAAASRRRRSTTCAPVAGAERAARRPARRSTPSRVDAGGRRLRGRRRAPRRASCRASSSARARARRCTCSAAAQGRGAAGRPRLRRRPTTSPRMAPPVLRHRLVLTPGGRARALPARTTPCRPRWRRCPCRGEPDAAGGAAAGAVVALPRCSCRSGSRCSPRWRSRVAVGADALAVRRRPEVEREVPAVLSRGVPAPLRRRAGAGARGAVRVRQPVPPDLRSIRARRTATLDAKLVARRRGRHTLPGLATRVVGPLGLGALVPARGRTPRSSSTRTCPARRLALAVRRGRFRDRRARARGPLGLGTEFESVRDYQPDDDIRQVNWRATERLGRPMSQPVPHRAGPRGDLPGRLRPA